MDSDPLFPRLTILRLGEPPQHGFGVDEIRRQLMCDYDRLSWVVVEHSWDPIHDMSFEADEGNLTVTEYAQYYESVRTDLTFAEVRPLMIKFLRDDSGWQTEIEWKCESSR